MKQLTLILCCLVVLSGVVCLAPQAQEWRHQAVVLTDTEKDETTLWVDNSDGILVDRLVLVENRDGTYRDTYEVKHVLDGHIILKERLRKSFLAGSKVFQ